MIKVFGQTDTSFSSNGDVVLQPLGIVCENIPVAYCELSEFFKEHMI